MPKLSVLSWMVIVVAQITYGLLVYAITRGYYEDSSVASGQIPTAETQVMPHPQTGSFDASLQSGMNIGLAAEALASDDPALISRLADDYFMRKEYSQAIKLYERALKINPDDADAHNDLGLSLYYIGQNQRALDILRTGVSKQPSFQRIHLTLGFVQAQTGNKEAASTAFKKAIALGPDNTVGQEASRMLNEIE
jgi:tetratricopeptide (TPR) repeat protein